MLPRIVSCVLIGLAWLAWQATTAACPFCSEERGPTLVGDFDQAAMVLVGTLSNPRPGQNGFDGATDLIIEEVLKHHDVLNDGKKQKTVLTLPRLLPQSKNKFVVFCDVYKGNIDPYRGVEIQPNSDLVKYLKGAVALKSKSQAERLRYCFDYLNSPEFDIAIDAYREYAKADYTDYKDMATKLNPDVIASWLRDPKTPPYRYGLYASLLGHCGKEPHAKLLRSMIDDPEKRKGSGIDGLLFGYVQLDTKGAWQYLTTLLKDDREEFLLRYAGLRTLRFLWDLRPDLVPKPEIVKGMALVLHQPDMADFAVEDLRKWKQWEMTDQVLDLFGKKDFQIPVVKRAILRYALQCSAANGHARAHKFVDEQRKRDLNWVKDTEELLKLEEPAPVKTK